MSIINSKAEFTAAERTLSEAPEANLERDLTYWTLASFDSAQEHSELRNRLMEVADRHREEEAWIGLVAREMRKRRQKAREASP